VSTTDAYYKFGAFFYSVALHHCHVNLNINMILYTVLKQSLWKVML